MRMATAADNGHRPLGPTVDNSIRIRQAIKSLPAQVLGRRHIARAVPTSIHIFMSGTALLTRLAARRSQLADTRPSTDVDANVSGRVSLEASPESNSS